MNQHLVFYDGDCPLCQRAVRFILSRDVKKQFLFAPLNGKAAKKELISPPQGTLILLQDYLSKNQLMLTEGKGALRVLWLLGGRYKALGMLSFLPSGLFDFFYRFIAKRRYKLFKRPLPLKTDLFEDRFLT